MSAVVQIPPGGNCAVVNGTTITSPSAPGETRRLVFRNGIVQPFEENPDVSGLLVIDARGGLIAPGLMEMHIHGCGKWIFGDCSSRELNLASEFLLDRGITAFVPTLPCRLQSLEHLVRALEGYQGNADIPGIYLEGPFINPQKRGGLPEDTIRKPDLGYLREILSAGKGRIRLMTIAPELPGIRPAAELLLQEGIIPCFGHSQASYQEAAGLLDWLRSQFPGRVPGMTHLFNASSSLSHQTPGLAFLPFLSDIPFELNADGTHVAPEMLRLVWQSVRKENLILISDALITAGLSPEECRTGGPYLYEKREVKSDGGGVRYRDNEVLAGSGSLIPQVMENFQKITGAGWPEVIFAASTAPRRFLSGTSGFGEIVPGGRTNLVILNGSMKARDVVLFQKT